MRNSKYYIAIDEQQIDLRITDARRLGVSRPPLSLYYFFFSKYFSIDVAS